MKVTGYRSLVTQHDWGRLIGDANGVMSEPRTDVHVLILETDSGLEGVGLGAHGDIDRVFGAVEGQDPRAVTALYDRMLARVFKTGHSGATFGAIGAIDMALWDLKAKMAGEPLWRTLGALDRFVPGYASGLDIALDDDALLRLYERFADRGFSAAKLKGGRNLEHDLRRLEALRDLLGRNSAHPALMFDANESWNRSQAVRFVTALERTVDLTWVEEPVRRWDARRARLGPARHPRRRRDRREPHRPGAVPATAGRRRDRHRPGRQRLGHHPFPAGGRRGARPRPAGQPGGVPRQSRGARRRRGAEPPGLRGAGPRRHRSG